MSEPTPNPLGICILTVSDTRTFETDVSGRIAGEAVEAAGHTLIERKILADDVAQIGQQVSRWVEQPEVQVVIVTGGTGLTRRDVTPEALEPLITKPIVGFGELFRALSFEEIGAATMQSRAFAGLAGQTMLFALPGSSGAVRLAMERIIVPQLDVRTKPCNFAMLIDRF